MNRKKIRPSDYGSLQALEHVYYELLMMMHSAHIIMKYYGNPENIEQETIRNALIESFAMHSRNIIEFLYLKRKEESILAADYFDDKNDWISKLSVRSQIINEISDRSSKEAAHLTYERLHKTLEDKSWQFPKYLRKLRNKINLFLEIVSPARVDDKFRDLVKAFNMMKLD